MGHVVSRTISVFVVALALGGLGCSAAASSNSSTTESDAPHLDRGACSQCHSGWDDSGQPIDPAEQADEEHRVWLTKTLESHKNYVTPEAIKGLTSFELKVPRAPALPQAVRTYLFPKGAPDGNAVHIYYGDLIDDINLIAEPRAAAPDFKADMMSVSREWFTIRGNQAMGWESSPGGPGARSSGGRIVWWEEGAIYQLIGGAGNNPTSLDELRALADTMD